MAIGSHQLAMRNVNFSVAALRRCAMKFGGAIVSRQLAVTSWLCGNFSVASLRRCAIKFGGAIVSWHSPVGNSQGTKRNLNCASAEKLVLISAIYVYIKILTNT